MNTQELLAELYKTWINEVAIPNGTLGCGISPEKMLAEIINKEKIGA